MFRVTGHSKTTINVICNVAWASSLGGLCLLAEERRRRLALAQKIIENGKRLQAYKSYTAVAAVAAFDLGEEWNSDLPNLVAHETIARDPIDHTLTNDEWRMRGRNHRLIPTTSLSLPFQGKILPWRGYSLQNVALPLLDHISSYTHHSGQALDTGFHNKSSSLSQTQNYALKDELALQHESTICPPRNLSHNTRSSTQDNQRYNIYLQDIIAQRAIDCFGSESSILRSHGYQELSSFFEQFHKHTSPLMDKALKLALSIPEPFTLNNTALEARQSMKRQMKLASMKQTVNQPSQSLIASILSKSPIRYSSPPGLNVEVPEAEFTQRIKSCLDAKQLDGAFYAFLALCEKTTKPISRVSRKLIREMTFAYKSLGLYSVVMDIQKKTLHSLKEWRLLYADMAWLMDHAAPKNNVEFCWEVVESFLKFDVMGQDSRVNLSLRFVQWFVTHSQPEHGIYLFMKVFQPQSVDCDPQQLKEVAQALYEQAVQADSFESAEMLLSWFNEHNITFSGDAMGKKLILNKILRLGHKEHAADLFMALRDCYENPDDAMELMKSLTDSDETFEEVLYDRCDALVRDLHQRQEYSAISKLIHILDDHSKLPPSTTVLFYHAFAMAGPLIEAKRTVDGLLSANVSLLQDIVHDSHAILLRRCWKTSRNFQLTEELFSSIRAVGFQQTRSVRTYNSMILACIEAGKSQAAQKYVEEMVNGARLKPDLDTWSHLMLGKALCKDWQGVSDDLKHAQTSGLLALHGGYEGMFFDSIFVEFCKQHNATQVVDFAIELTTPDFLTITHRMAEAVVDTVVQSEDIDMLRRWVQHMHSRGCTPCIGKESVARILNRIMQSKKLKFHPTLSEAHHLHITQGALDIPQLLDHLNAVNTQQGPTRNSLEQKTKHIKVKRPDSRRVTERAMINALSNDEPIEALRLYKESLVHGLPRQQVDLELAVRASLTMNPQSNVEALNLVEDAEAAGLNTDRTKTPLLIHGLQQRTLTEEEAHEIVFQFYDNIDAPRMLLHHHVTIAVVKNLNNNGNADGALRLLKAVNESQWAERKPLDLPILTICLQSLLKTANMDGVDWVVNLVLRRNLRIDKIFVHTLHNALQASQRRTERLKYLRQVPDKRKSSWTEALSIHLDNIRARRDHQRHETLTFAKQTVRLFTLKADGETSLGRQVVPKVVAAA